MADKPKRLSREFAFDRAKIDENKRTVEVAFSSENPVERWWGENEILGHGRGEYDISLLNDGAPLLLNHDTNRQIGVVENAKVDSDKVGRATVRFGNSPLANEIFQDVKDGIRKKISFGYEHTGLIKSEKKDGQLPDARYSWRAYEVSIVPIPADNDVGVGRSAPVDSPEIVDVDSIAKKLNPEQRENMKRSLYLLDPSPALTKPAEGAAPAVDEGKVRSGALEIERKRAKEIQTTADELIKDHPQCADKIRTMVRESLEADTSIGDFQIRAMKEVLGAKPVKPVLMMDLGMSEEEQRSYSVLRGIQSCLRRNSTEPDGLEGDVHKAMSKLSIPGSREGFMVPADARVRCRADRRMQRDLNVSTFAQGGATVQTSVVTPIIELLRNRMVTDKLGIIVMAGLTGNVAIPRQTGAATGYSLPESATLTKSTQALDQILLAPHRVGATNDYTRQLLLQSSIDVENFIRDDLMKVIALKWDYLILNGAGAGSEPTGIINTPGIGSVVFGAAATFAKLVAFETALAVLNADDGSMAYVTTPAVRGTLKSAAKLLVGATTVAAVALWEKGGAAGEGEVNGYRALATNQVLNNGVIFGNWGDVVQGLYGGYDVIVNPYSRDVDAAVRITVNTFGDVAVRHPASFCVSGDAGNQ